MYRIPQMLIVVARRYGYDEKQSQTINDYIMEYYDISYLFGL